MAGSLLLTAFSAVLPLMVVFLTFIGQADHIPPPSCATFPSISVLTMVMLICSRKPLSLLPSALSSSGGTMAMPPPLEVGCMSTGSKNSVVCVSLTKCVVV